MTWIVAGLAPFAAVLIWMACVDPRGFGTFTLVCVVGAAMTASIMYGLWQIGQIPDCGTFWSSLAGCTTMTVVAP